MYYSDSLMFYTGFTVKVYSFQVMTLAAVPSTLVKCLYLFFDLPKLQSDEQKSDDNDGGEDEFSARERRRLLQKMFIQV